MKRLITYLFLSYLIFIPKSFSKSYGEGDLKLNDNMIEYFHKYLKGKGNQRPLIFSIAVDGSYAIYWYCPASQCTGTNATEYNKICAREAGVECKVFARGRYIKWKNGINKGKGKDSKINSRQSFSELKIRLTELGFVGDVVSKNTTEITKSTTKKETTKVTSATKGDLDGFMNALEKAKNAGLTIDGDSTAKQFGFNDFEEFFNEYKRTHDVGDITLDDAKEFLLGADNTVDIVESQENLNKLHDLIINNKHFRKRTGYFKKKYRDKTKILIVYMNYEKEMAKISKNPNLDKIGKFDFRYRHWTNPGIFNIDGLIPEAFADCEKSRKKYKLSGGECILVESRYKDQVTNLLKPRLKDKKKKKTLVTQKKIKIKKKSLDNDPPVIDIKDTIVVKSSNWEINGKVSDEGSKLIYVKVAGQDIPVNNGKFKIKKYSPSDTKIKITAIDEWGNEATKLVKIKVKKEENIVKKLDPLNPLAIKSMTNDNKLALIIGIENYSDLAKASYANNDAQYFKDYANNILGIKNENINLLVDEDATFIKINKVLKKWLKSKVIPGKTDLIIFYAGHGLATQDGDQQDLFLLPHNADTDLLSISSISRNNLFNEISNLDPQSVTIFFDACYSGTSRDNKSLIASARPINILKKVEDNIPENFTIFSASQLNQMSSGLKNGEHGIFSYYLMKGLEGFADQNKDKKITNGELQIYMNLNVSQRAAEWGREQNPSLVGDPDKILMSY